MEVSSHTYIGMMNNLVQNLLFLNLLLFIFGGPLGAFQYVLQVFSSVSESLAFDISPLWPSLLRKIVFLYERNPKLDILFFEKTLITYPTLSTSEPQASSRDIEGGRWTCRSTSTSLQPSFRIHKLSLHSI